MTILFADVSGSTSWGTARRRVDARADGPLLRRDATIIERHGGTVEKFIGDAVMAVFGIPQLHEDDALRAVRAATEIRERLMLLNVELDAERGIAIRVRTGVNTGEVVAGDPTDRQTLITGDAVNTAARLEQTAAPGEIVIGPTTHQLVRDAVSVEPLEPLALKGKAAARTRLPAPVRHPRRGGPCPSPGRAVRRARVRAGRPPASLRRGAGRATLQVGDPARRGRCR